MGNEFVAMIKDSALVSVLGVQDITQQAKVYSASSFRFFETYNTVAFLYLTLTISLSILVRHTTFASAGTPPAAPPPPGPDENRDDVARTCHGQPSMIAWSVRVMDVPAPYRNGQGRRGAGAIDLDRVV